MSITLDIVIAILLACTIGYAYILNRRLTELKRDKTHLEGLVVSFASAAERAEEGVAKLSEAADQVTCQLRVDLGEAEILGDDLKFLLERGESVADRLEGAVRSARGVADATLPTGTVAGVRDVESQSIEPSAVEPRGLSPAEATAPASDLLVSRSDAERELIRALQLAR